MARKPSKKTAAAKPAAKKTEVVDKKARADIAALGEAMVGAAPAKPKNGGTDKKARAALKAMGAVMAALPPQPGDVEDLRAAAQGAIAKL